MHARTHKMSKRARARLRTAHFNKMYGSYILFEKNQHNLLLNTLWEKSRNFQHNPLPYKHLKLLRVLQKGDQRSI